MTSNPSPQPPEALSEFQSAYSQYLRAPDKQVLPPGIPKRRSEIYEALLFNNIRGFIDKCFPVAKKLTGDDQWLRLSRAFYEHWHCRTPIFSQIPWEFVSFINIHNQELEITDWLPELLHYEWLELEVDLDQTSVSRVHMLDSPGDCIRTNPTLKVCQYQWPVHKIGANYLPSEPEPVILCVYRTYEFEVCFMEVNAVSAVLLEELKEHAETPSAALAALANRLPQLNPNQIDHFGHQLIEQLIGANVLVVLSRQGKSP